MEAEIILSIVVASSTVVYTIINAMMWWESRAARLQKTTPHIVAYLKTSETEMNICLYIKNIGEGYAKDVSLTVISDYVRFGDEKLSLSNLFIAKEEITSFPPQYELKYYLDERIKEFKDETFEIEINYFCSRDKRYSERFKFTPAIITDQNYTNPPDSFIGQIAYYLKKISDNTKKH